MSHLASAREVDHEITVRAPAQEVYRFIVDVDDWPQVFPPTVHVECVERGHSEEVIRIWATANGEPRTWTSQRWLDPEALRVDFRQRRSTHPVAHMGGAWLVEPLSADESRVRLLHDYRAVDDDEDALVLIDKAVDRNSRSELAALKNRAEALTGAPETLMSFSDCVSVRGPATEVYDFVNQADKWAERLPHVARVALTEDTPGLQTLEMDTRAADGSTHTTSSVRVCFPHERIVYKQLRVPRLMTLHTGRWSFEEKDGETLVTSQHTVMVDTGAIGAVLGENSDLADARRIIRSSLGGNSMATMNLAKEYVENKG